MDLDGSRYQALHTRAQGRALGKARRDEVPLESHAEIPASEVRADALGLLRSQDAARIQSLVPIRHGRMSASAFTFYRGSALIMASDLSLVPSSGIAVQLCGDAHLSNFGLYMGPDRRLVFDLNDFDETLPGDFEWDVKRLAASVTIAGRSNGHSDKKTLRATIAAVSGYRKTVDKASRLSPLDLHYQRLEMDRYLETADDELVKSGKRVKEEATRKNSMRAFSKLTIEVNGHRRIASDPPLIVGLGDVADETRLDDLADFFEDYLETLLPHRRALVERYRITDVAHKVVGVGSVGTRCFIVLVESGDGAPLFMQFKQASPSVLENYIGASEFVQAGERVVRGQQLLQAAGDVLLGWSRHIPSEDRTRDYYIRQLWDGKASADVDEMSPKRLRRYARLCGRTLALAHARSANPSVVAGYLGSSETFEHAVAEFASSYADINDQDYAVHTAAIADGRLDAAVDI